jgi:hypothetical protein
LKAAEASAPSSTKSTIPTFGIAPLGQSSSASLQEFGTGDHVGFRVHRRHRESPKMSDKRLAAEDLVDENHTRAHRYVGNDVVGVSSANSLRKYVSRSFAASQFSRLKAFIVMLPTCNLLSG